MRDVEDDDDRRSCRRGMRVWTRRWARRLVRVPGTGADLGVDSERPGSPGVRRPQSLADAPTVLIDWRDEVQGSSLVVRVGAWQGAQLMSKHIHEPHRQALERTVGKVQTVTAFLANLREAFKDTGWADSIAKVVPWTGAVFESAAENLGPIKFIVDIFKKATEINDPEQLAWIACTLAYQRALERALLDIGSPQQPLGELLEYDFKWLDASSTESFETFSFDYALLHPFTREQNRAVEAYGFILGYTRRSSGCSWLASRNASCPSSRTCSATPS
jgi:hypothetical protein